MRMSVLCFFVFTTLLISCKSSLQSPSIYALSGSNSTETVEYSKLAQPIQSPQLIKQKSSQTLEKTWSGESGDDYCRLNFDQFETKSNLSQNWSKKSILRHARSLEKEGLLQESIWLYNFLGRYSKASRLEVKLKNILNEDPIEQVDHNFTEGSVPKILLKFRYDIYAIFKPEVIHSGQMNWLTSTNEAVVYEIDHFLGTNIVPMTVLRHVRLPNNEILYGSVQYWIKNGLSHGRASHANTYDFPAMKVLDYVIANGDRKDANFLFLTDLEKLIAIDNGNAFMIDSCGEPNEIFKFLNLNPHLKGHFQHLDPDGLDSSLSSELPQEQIHKIKLRIQHLKEQISEEQ